MDRRTTITNSYSLSFQIYPTIYSTEIVPDTLERTDYVGNLIYDRTSLQKVLFDGGYVDMSGDSPEYRFFVMDHLGGNRLVADASGAILQTNHYDPYGESLPAGSAVDSGNPYKYGGKEYDDKALAYDFGARHYTSSIPRWTTMDPLCEKYYSISPYAYCAGNPVNLVDPNGMYFLDEQDEKEAREIERQLKRKAYRYARKANRLKGKPNAKYDEYSQRANELFLSMRDIRDMRDNEKMAFHFDSYQANKEQKDLKSPETISVIPEEGGHPIVTMYTNGKTDNTIHEIRHGGQFARGEMAKLSQFGLEQSAYRAQLAWEGSITYISKNRHDEFSGKNATSQEIADENNPLLWIYNNTVTSINAINKAFLQDILIINNGVFEGLYPELL